MKNKFWSIKTSSGTTKNFTVFADGSASVQYIGEKITTKYLGNVFKKGAKQ
jgi:hypothetical protein